MENTEDNRRRYRELLFTTAGWGQYVSGVILYDETIRQKSSNGTPFVEILKNAGVIPGIKVDIGAKALAFSPDEKVTEGLDKLRERFAEYAQLGAKFAKWRAVIKIDAAKNLPTSNCLHVNAHALARYAALAQEAGLVPIVEPEVLMDGSHSIEACFDVTKRTLERVFDELDKQRVPLEGTLLKPNMVISGEDSPTQADANTIAEMTVRCLKEAVPASVPGIVFLSGGQSEEVACVNLNALNQLADRGPWQLSFSYGRALQQSALKAWSGRDENLVAGQAAFLKRCKLTSAARSGTYRPEMES
ncbi:MAG: fructose-bisphosphate aldolase [Candidatus Magasanikbacteria bacterium RIFCSPHIGHO2_02_FULL_51_14]|uniref:Fructose-bisphosphate aldolase n=1 Tax=Candidatus Magasanikbacteria bacterium RIFCSPHIGHO2_02_FULL_51_14 TaxID=1798683 RepID=A0A1F6MQ83_9BACT|nr:MAG: fructose-bisphosphate aldolase [Candidatus Magasanikbacteria bacterium RIFCSPHIGHO2_02_FULL_51_14]